jgi:uncharacterized protein
MFENRFIICFLLLSSISLSCLAESLNSAKSAILTGDITKAKQQLKTIDVNQPLADGSSLLAWAVESQEPAMVNLLLAYQAKALKSDPQNPSFSPLLLACQYGNTDILRALLDAGADVNDVSSNGISALTLCAGSAPTTIVKRFIEQGAKVTSADVLGQTALMHAAANGKSDNVSLLLNSGANINRVTKKGFTPLFFALKSNNKQLPITLIKAGADTDYVAPDNTSVVQMAMYHQHYATAQYLVERNADLHAYDRNGLTLLHIAVKERQAELVDLLLKKGADVNALSAESQVKWRFESNFKTGVYIPPINTPLLLAAELGDVELMQMLVKSGADLSIRNPKGNNVVLAAAQSTNPQALELALSWQDDANVKNASGQTPMHIVLYTASGAELENMLKTLASKGARIDTQNNQGKSPLDIANNDEFTGKSIFSAIFKT